MVRLWLKEFLLPLFSSSFFPHPIFFLCGDGKLTEKKCKSLSRVRFTLHWMGALLMTTDRQLLKHLAKNLQWELKLPESSLGLVVMEWDSQSEGCGFKSQHRMQDGHFSHDAVVKKLMIAWKDRIWTQNRPRMSYLKNIFIKWRFEASKNAVDFCFNEPTPSSVSHLLQQNEIEGKLWDEIDVCLSWLSLDNACTPLWASLSPEN